MNAASLFDQIGSLVMVEGHGDCEVVVWTDPVIYVTGVDHKGQVVRVVGSRTRPATPIGSDTVDVTMFQDPHPVRTDTPLVRVVNAARSREKARRELREAIFAAAADGALSSQIAAAAGCSKRYVGYVLRGKRLKARSQP